jgi:hypothetical protein
MKSKIHTPLGGGKNCALQIELAVRVLKEGTIELA